MEPQSRRNMRKGNAFTIEINRKFAKKNNTQWLVRYLFAKVFKKFRISNGLYVIEFGNE